MFVVYWSTMVDGVRVPECRTFDPALMENALGDALKFSNDQRNLDGVSHVSLASELANSVGKRGVDYQEKSDWKKRRV